MRILQQMLKQFFSLDENQPQINLIPTGDGAGEALTGAARLINNHKKMEVINNG